MVGADARLPCGRRRGPSAPPCVPSACAAAGRCCRRCGRGRRCSRCASAPHAPCPTAWHIEDVERAGAGVHDPGDVHRRVGAGLHEGRHVATPFRLGLFGQHLHLAGARSAGARPNHTGHTTATSTRRKSWLSCLLLGRRGQAPGAAEAEARHRLHVHHPFQERLQPAPLLSSLQSPSRARQARAPPAGSKRRRSAARRRGRGATGSVRARVLAKRIMARHL